MTNTTPSARRRNANLIATATQIVGDTAVAAVTVYQPIADHPGEPVAVSAQELHFLSASAPLRLEQARSRDREQWPDQTWQDDTERERSAAGRAALAEVETLLDTEPADLLPQVRPAVPEITPADAARIAPTDAVAELLDGDLTVERVTEIAQAGDVHPAELIDEALTLTTSAACLGLQEAAAVVMTDPSAAAETALHATSHLVATVQIASLDLP